MVLDPFPDGVSVLHRRICEASTDAWRWVCVIRSIERMWPGARCEILGEAHEGAGVLPIASGRVTRDGFGLEEGSSFWADDPNPLGSAGRRPGEVFPLALSAAGGEAGAALVLHRCRTRDWLLVVRTSPGAPKRVTRFLQSWALALIPAFRISHALAIGQIPSKQDCDLIWDRLDDGVALCSGDLRLLHANVAAEELLAIRVAFRPCGGGRLRLHANGGDERLEWAASRVLSGARRRERVLVRGALEMQHLAIGLSAVRHSPFAPMVPHAGGGADDRLVLTLALRAAQAPSSVTVHTAAETVENETATF